MDLGIPLYGLWVADVVLALETLVAEMILHVAD